MEYLSKLEKFDFLFCSVKKIFFFILFNLF
jgi:hypothetical protein